MTRLFSSFPNSRSTVQAPIFGRSSYILKLFIRTFLDLAQTDAPQTVPCKKGGRYVSLDVPCENPVPTRIRSVLRSRRGCCTAYTRRGDEGPPRGRRTLTGREASQEDYRKQIISVEILLANSLDTPPRSNRFGSGIVPRGIAAANGPLHRFDLSARNSSFLVYVTTVQEEHASFVRLNFTHYTEAFIKIGYYHRDRSTPKWENGTFSRNLRIA